MSKNNLSFRDSFTFDSIINDLPKLLRNDFKELDTEKHQEYIKRYRKNKKNTINLIIDDMDFSEEKYLLKETIKYMEEQGTNNPSEVTIGAFHNQNMRINADKFFNTMAPFLTLDIHKQLESTFYNTQFKQSLVNMAQLDELIKQNDTIIAQNETIIQLLNKIANK